MLALKSDIFQVIETETNILSSTVDNYLKEKGFILGKIKARLNCLYFNEIAEFLNADALVFSFTHSDKEINIYINEQIMYAEILLAGTIQVLESNCTSFYEDGDFYRIEEIESFIRDLTFIF